MFLSRLLWICSISDIYLFIFHNKSVETKKSEEEEKIWKPRSRRQMERREEGGGTCSCRALFRTEVTSTYLSLTVNERRNWGQSCMSSNFSGKGGRLPPLFFVVANFKVTKVGQDSLSSNFSFSHLCLFGKKVI